MSFLTKQRVTARCALSTGNAVACLSAVVGYFYFGYWFSRMRA